MSLEHTLSVRRHSVCTACPAYTVLLVLADYASEDGYCWPSLAKLAEESRCHRATVIRAIDEHIKSGELIKVTRGNVGMSNRYIVAVGMSEGALRIALKKYGSSTPEQDVSKALKNARVGWGSRESDGVVAESDGAVAESDGGSSTVRRGSSTVRRGSSTVRRGSSTVRPDPSNILLRSSNDPPKDPQGTHFLQNAPGGGHGELSDQQSPPQAPSPAQSTRKRGGKGGAKDAPHDPKYSAWHTRVVAHWDDEYKATSRGERYRYTPQELAALKRSGLHKVPIEDMLATISAFLRITERQDKYLANNRTIWACVRSWNHRLLSEARRRARASPDEDAEALLAEDDALRERQRLAIEREGHL